MDKQLIALKLRQKVCPMHRKTPKVEARLDGFRIEGVFSSEQKTAASVAVF